MADHAHPVFFGQPDAPLAGLLLLAPEARRRIAVVWAPSMEAPAVTWPAPDGHTEHIAQQLIDHGYPSLRWDAPGTGNSVAPANLPDDVDPDAELCAALDLAINALAECSACTGVVLVAPPGRARAVRRVACANALVVGWVHGLPLASAPPEFEDTGMVEPPWTADPDSGEPLSLPRLDAPWDDPALPTWIEWLDGLNHALGDSGAWPMPRPRDYAQWPLAGLGAGSLREQWQPLHLGPDRQETVVAVLGERLPAPLGGESPAPCGPVLLLAAHDDQIGAEAVAWSRQWQSEGLRVLRVPVPPGWSDAAGALGELIQQALPALSANTAPVIVACGALASAVWQDLAADPALVPQGTRLVLLRADMDSVLSVTGAATPPPDDVLHSLVPALNLPADVQPLWPVFGTPQPSAPALATPLAVTPPGTVRTRWETLLQQAQQILRRSAEPPGLPPGLRPWLQQLRSQAQQGPQPLARDMDALAAHGVTSHWLMPAGQPDLLRWAWALSGECGQRVADGRVQISALAPQRAQQAQCLRQALSGTQAKLGHQA